VQIQIPQAGQEVTRETFSFQVDQAKLKAAQQRDGHYLLRSNLTGQDPAVLWARYVQLTQIESVFRSLKSELGVRPIYHQLEHRADAHDLIAFLAYCLQVTLKNRLLIHAPGLTPAAVLEKLATIQMVEVWIPLVDGRWLVLPRHTQSEKDVQAMLDHLHMALPSQPPPRIKAPQVPSLKKNPPPSLRCCEDLWPAFTKFHGLSLWNIRRQIPLVNRRILPDTECPLPAVRRIQRSGIREGTPARKKARTNKCR
jgi:hypothetical protein